MSKRTVKGKLVRDDQSPLRDSLVQLWDRDFGMDDLLGQSMSDQNGNFSITYDPDDAGIFDDPDLTLKVIKIDASGDRRVVVDHDDPPDEHGSYGAIIVTDWSYDRTGDLPLIRAGYSLPENFELPQSVKLAGNFVKYGVLREIAEKKKSLDAVQEIFPKNLTQEMEEEEPGSTKTDDFFIDSLMNGFNPARLIHDTADDSYLVRYNIDKYQVDGSRRSPSVELRLDRKPGKKLVPRSIKYRIRNKGTNPARFGATKTVKPGDGGWEQAKLYFRIADLVDGQVKGHLGRGHINVGQYAIAAYRNLHKSPVLKLLHPHVKSVSTINDKGNETIFGKSGVLMLTPLTSKSIRTCMRDDLGACDWKSWSPRKAFNSKHVYARVQQLYWEILTEYVDQFFSAYGNKIRRDWKEIYYFSQDLIEHAVPYRKEALKAGEQWVDVSEVSSRTDGKAISEITQVKIAPTDGDVENLKELCRYVIYHATMWHDWRNDSQRHYAGDARFSRLSIDYTANDAAHQVFIANLLTKTKYGYLSKNEDDDIPEMFTHLLKSAKPKFDKLKYDLSDLRSRINI